MNAEHELVSSSERANFGVEDWNIEVYVSCRVLSMWILESKLEEIETLFLVGTRYDAVNAG